MENVFNVLFLKKEDFSDVCSSLIFPLEKQFNMRLACKDDISDIINVDKESFDDENLAMTPDMLEQRLIRFPLGNWVLQKGQQIVGCCCTMLVEDNVDKIISWDQTTGNGTISTHSEQGKALFGVNTSLIPEAHGIGATFLKELTHLLVVGLQLHRGFGAGRLIGYNRVRDKMSPEEFACQVNLEFNIQPVTPIAAFLIRAGGKYIKILPNYWPIDADSAGHGILFEWVNPFVRLLK